MTSALAGIGGHRDLAADFAVDLHRNLDHIGVQVLRIGLGPPLVGERLLMAQALPELLGDVRREGREQQHERLGDAARHARPLVRRVDELHERGDRRIEAQRLEVLGHLRDRLMQHAQLLGRGLGTGSGTGA